MGAGNPSKVWAHYSLPENDRITDPKVPSALMYHILPEHHFTALFPIRRQSAKRLLAPFAGILIGRRDEATVAGLHHPEADVTDLDPAPFVFLVRLSTCNHEVRAEPVHRQRLGQPAVEVGERCFRDEEKGEPVGEADPRAWWREGLGPYMLQLSTTSPQAESCEEEVWVVRGIATDQELSSTDCADAAGRFHHDALSLILWAGEGLALTQTSSEFRPSLRLVRRSGEAIAEAEGSESGIATIEFTADLTRGEYIIIASSVEAQESGAYTLTVSETAAAVVDEVSQRGRINPSGGFLGLRRSPLVGPLFDWKR